MKNEGFFRIFCKLLSIFATVEIVSSLSFMVHVILVSFEFCCTIKNIDIDLVLFSTLPLVNGVFMQSKSNRFLSFVYLLPTHFELLLQHYLYINSSLISHGLLQENGTIRSDDKQMGLLSLMVKMPDLYMLLVTPNDVSVIIYCIVLYCTY